jgi:hypothetical protein
MIHYALRITFGIVHSVIITLCSFGLAIFFPSLSLFPLFGCIIIPILSLFLTIFCNGCVEYVSKSSLTITHILETSWIPPIGIFIISLILLPLGSMPLLGPINIRVITSITINFFITTILQVYAAREIQASKSSGVSGPT